jgi:hypothetical protein
MNTCDSVQAALLDESVARDGDAVMAHVATCAACSAVAAAHRSALSLKGAALPVPRRRPVAEAQRRAGVVFGLVLVLGGGAGWAWLALNPPASPQPVALAPQEDVVLPGELSQPVAEDAAQWEGLVQLQLTARLAVASEFREEEVTRRVFGALPGWVAPKKSSPMRSLGLAASPVVYTQEDVP